MHNLFGERFYSLRQPAWHGLGKVMDAQMGAEQAFDTIGAYDVRLDDLRTVGGLPVPQKAVVRSATGDQPEVVLSVVGEDYVLVTPRQIVNAWDGAITSPVETMGALGKGETLFVSTKLPAIDVKGDLVEMYLLLLSPMTGADAISAMVTGVRAVCQNTVTAAVRASTERHRITHDSRALDRVTLWLDHLMTKAQEKVDAQNRAFRAMADHPVNGAEVDNVLELVYTMPALPRREAMPEMVFVERMETAQYQRERMQLKRAGVVELFEGRGVGMNTPAARGTAWGLYNAVVEMEDYGGRGKGRTVAESALVGDRARTKAAAFDACLDLTK